jgi:hypothetical protein
MIYVISVCADQSEAINTALHNANQTSPYELQDVLPGGEKALKTPGNLQKGFADGGRDKLAHLITRECKAFDTIEKVAWEKGSSPFGLRVYSFIIFICISLLTFFFFKKKSFLIR